MSTIIESIEQRQLQQVPRFAPGDRVRVHFQVIEGTAQAHPGLRGHRHRPPGQRRARDLHRPQAVVRRRRRADLPGPLAEDRAARGRRPRRRPPGEALLPARPRRQARPGRRAPLGDRGRPRPRRGRGAGGDRLRGRRPGGGRARRRPPRARRPRGRRARPRQAEEDAERSRTSPPRAEPPTSRRRTSPRRGVRSRRRGRGCRGTQLIPKPTTGRGALIELVVIVALAIGLALGIQAFIVKPYQIPSPSMVPTLEVGQRVLVNRLSYRLGGDPEIGDIVVFHPPTGASHGQRVRRRDRAAARAVPGADPGDGGRELHQAGRRRPRRHALRIEDGIPIVNGEPSTRTGRSAHVAGSAAATSRRRSRSPQDHYFMMGDNRGPATTAATGARSRATGSSARPSSPTGRPTDRLL